MLGIEQLIIFLIYCYSVTAVSGAYLLLIDLGQMFDFMQSKVLQPLSTKSGKGWQVLYKALGGCEACNTMWFALLLYPVYYLITSKYGYNIANDIPTLAAFWLLSPMIAYDILILKNN